MVQEYQSPVRVYKYPFDLVMVAYERRFPRCPQIPVVLDCVVTEDSWSSDNSQRHTTRRCQLNVDAPYLLKKIIGVEHVYFIQKNHLDRKTKSLLIEAINETFSSRVAVVEKCRYFMHPENPEWTCFDQSATLDVKNFFGFENSIEKIAMKQYSSNIAKGKEIIDYFVTEIRAEGIESVSAWCEDSSETNTKARALICRGAPPVGALAAALVHSPSLEDQAKAGARNANSSPPHNGDKYQLDSEYIQRYLGELTVMQESRLVQLKKLVSELQKGKVPNDGTLLRFLRARDFNVEKAREMLSQSLIWRKRHQVDRILSEYETPQVVKDYFPGGWHHHDIDGRPLYILRLGQMDVKGLLKSIGEDGLLKMTLHVCEEGLTKLQTASASSGVAVGAWTLLVDLEGLNMRHLWRPGVRALLRIIQIVEANYPDTMARVLVIRAPRVFPILWTIVSTFIDENTRTKFLFYGGKDYLQPTGGLCDYIPNDVVPDFLGGPCKSFVHEGGLVPKNLYSSNVFTERSENDPLNEDSIYKFVSVGKGQFMEILVRNTDPCSVLTWDFDVVRHDLSFTVFRTPRPMHLHPHHDNPIGVAALCSISASDDEEDEDPDENAESKKEEAASKSKGVAAAMGTGTVSTKSAFDRPNWKEGSHYHRVEPTILCHNGESIQGSHVMTERGSYVLQWRWAGTGSGYEPPVASNSASVHSAPTADLLDSFTQHSHKAQLMYFYEVLTSHDYKGSMSSLQSSNSLQSGVSATSSCPSR